MDRLPPSGPIRVRAVTGSGPTEHALATEALAREVGDLWCVAVCLLVQGRAALRRGDLDAAAVRFGRSLEQHSRTRGLSGMLIVLEATAEVAAADGQPQVAARLPGSSRSSRLRLAIPLPPVYHKSLRATENRLRAALGKASFDQAWAAARALPIEEAVGLADSYLASRAGTHAPADPDGLGPRRDAPRPPLTQADA